MLPSDFPKWQSVYFYFKIWNENPKSNTGSVLEAVLKKIGRLNTYKKWQKRND